MGFWPGRFDLNQTNGTLARGGACRDWVLVNRALTDAQNFGDAFLARPTLAQRINLTAILIFIRRCLFIGNLLQSQEVTPSSHHSIMRWIVESASSRKDARTCHALAATHTGTPWSEPKARPGATSPACPPCDGHDHTGQCRRHCLILPLLYGSRAAQLAR